MHKVQKTSRQEFKCEAVRLAQTSGKSIAQVAREWVNLMPIAEQHREEEVCLIKDSMCKRFSMCEA